MCWKSSTLFDTNLYTGIRTIHNAMIAIKFINENGGYTEVFWGFFFCLQCADILAIIGHLKHKK